LNVLTGGKNEKWQNLVGAFGAKFQPISAFRAKKLRAKKVLFLQKRRVAAATGDAKEDAPQLQRRKPEA